MRSHAFFVVAVTLIGCNSSSSYGTAQDCIAAGGQCTGTGAAACIKEGPEQTCNCNPGCNPGGSFCCLVFPDASDGSSPVRDAASAD